MPYKRSKNTTKPKAKHLGQNTKETAIGEESSVYRSYKQERKTTKTMV